MAKEPTAPSNTAPKTANEQASPGFFSASSMSRSNNSPYLNILVYGPHGAGKTTLLGSMADVQSAQDILVITAEGGTIVYENNDRIENFDILDVIKVDRIDQFQKCYEFLRAHCAMRDNPEREDDLWDLQSKIGLDAKSDKGARLRRYRTVIVDSLSEIEAACLAKILNLDSIGFDAGEDMEVARFDDFRKNNHIMQRIVRQFRDLPMHVLMTCAQGYEQDERKAYHYTPKLTGQLKTQIQGFFDIVGWLVPNQNAINPDTGIAERYLFVQPQTAPRADAKCRLASYKKAFFQDPVMKDILRGTGLITKE